MHQRLISRTTDPADARALTRNLGCTLPFEGRDWVVHQVTETAPGQWTVIWLSVEYSRLIDLIVWGGDLPMYPVC